MSLPNTRYAFIDCFEVYDRALLDPLGIRIPVRDIDAATTFRMRMHQARKIDREDNKDAYPDGHPMHGRSPFDRLAIRIKNIAGDIYLYIEPYTTPLGIEPLSEVSDGTELRETLPNRSNPRPLLESMGASSSGGDRSGGEDGRQAEVDEPPIRSKESLRRL